MTDELLKRIAVLPVVEKVFLMRDLETEINNWKKSVLEKAIKRTSWKCTCPNYISKRSASRSTGLIWIWVDCKGVRIEMEFDCRFQEKIRLDEDACDEETVIAKIKELMKKYERG